MENKATVFSEIYHIGRKNDLKNSECEDRLRDFIGSVGKALSQNNTILGHIKVLARIPEPAADAPFMALSVTKPDHVDVTPAAFGLDAKQGLELYVNVIVFGYTAQEVEAVVSAALMRTRLLRQ
ncbi:MAG TPA: hypothetical protein VN611_15480 [Patescibacteria group bacterium]|nr:hypothetical protein [Patescibacteria group bacterium]